MNNQEGCTVPPEGWSCSRVAGHEGPCAATPTEEGLDMVDEVAIAISYQRLIGGTPHDMARAAIATITREQGR